MDRSEISRVAHRDHPVAAPVGVEEVRRLVLTASGGPFRGRTREQLADVTPEEAETCLGMLLQNDPGKQQKLGVHAERTNA